MAEQAEWGPSTFGWALLTPTQRQVIPWVAFGLLLLLFLWPRRQEEEKERAEYADELDVSK